MRSGTFAFTLRVAARLVASAARFRVHSARPVIFDDDRRCCCCHCGRTFCTVRIRHGRRCSRLPLALVALVAAVSLVARTGQGMEHVRRRTIKRIALTTRTVVGIGGIDKHKIDLQRWIVFHFHRIRYRGQVSDKLILICWVGLNRNVNVSRQGNRVSASCYSQNVAIRMPCL